MFYFRLIENKNQNFDMLLNNSENDYWIILNVVRYIWKLALTNAELLIALVTSQFL